MQLNRTLLLFIFLSFSISAEEKPNILLLLADDLGYNDLGAFNNNLDVPTPSLNQLANQSLMLKRFYTESTCSASRIALLTGRYPARAGFRPVGRGIPPEWTTLAEHLQQNGYNTHHVGKWHMGFHEKAAWPVNQGFNTSFGFLNQWLLSKPFTADEFVFSKPSYFNPWLQDEHGALEQYQGHLSDILTQHSVKLIESADQKPWFIYHAFYLPHRPIQPAPRYKKKFPDTAEGRYLAMLNHLDDATGEIVESLKKSGQFENTIIIFLSDNGGTTQSKKDNNTPFYGKKNQYYEGGIRTPAFIHWPPTIKAERTNNISHIMDIYPSLAEILDTSISDDLDGTSLFAPVERNLFWDTYGADQHSFSVLSRDGKSRYYEYLGMESFSPLSILKSGVGIPPIFFLFTKNKLKFLFPDWRADVSQVNVSYQRQSENGRGIITGNDFQRSPGLSGFTFGIGAFPTDHDKSSIIATQKDLFQIRFTDHKVVAEIEGVQLQSKKLENNVCHEIVLTAHLLRNISIIGQSNRENTIELFINGELHDQKIAKQFDIPSVNPKTPTYIGQSQVMEDQFSGDLRNPSFLNVKVHNSQKANQYSITAFSSQLCQH